MERKNQIIIASIIVLVLLLIALISFRSVTREHLDGTSAIRTTILPSPQKSTTSISPQKSTTSISPQKSTTPTPTPTATFPQKMAISTGTVTSAIASSSPSQINSLFKLITQADIHCVVAPNAQTGATTYTCGLKLPQIPNM